jgi:hypothetical protein
MQSTQKTTRPFRYGASSYDDNFCLRPSLLLWLAMLYLSRALLLPLMAGIASMSGSGDAATLTRGLFSPDAYLPSALALVVIGAWCRRTPSATRVPRWIWAHGRTFLAAAAILDLVLANWAPFQQGYDVGQLTLPRLIGAALDAYFLAYVLAAQRVRDVFAQFPVPVPAPR